MENLFGEQYTELPKKKRKPQDKEKRSWENAFQRWSDKAAQDETDGYGICTWGLICNYCTDNHIGRPCVRALNYLLRKNHLSVDYSDRSEECFKKWFDGGET